MSEKKTTSKKEKNTVDVKKKTTSKIEKNPVDTEKNKKLFKTLAPFIVVLAVIIAILLGFNSMIETKAQQKADKIVEEAIKDAIEQFKKDNPAVYTEVTESVVYNLVIGQVNMIGELATLEVPYKDVTKFEDANKIKDFKLPFTTKSLIITWEGVIKFGIDVEKITFDVDDVNKVITVNLPEAKLLSHTIDKDKVEALDEKNNLFNKITADDTLKTLTEAQKATEQRIIESGAIDKAYNNAKIVITTLINANNIITTAGYKIEFSK